MAEQKVIVTETTDTLPTQAIDRRDFFTRNSKKFIYAGTAVILLLGAWLGYKYFIKMPKERNATEAVYSAEALFDKMAVSGFNKDSVGIVLNGGTLNGNKVTGLLKIMNQYGGTHAANRAAFMAGAAYMHIGDYDKSIKYLKDFDSHGAHQSEIKADLMLAQAYAEKKQTAEALSWYKKAAAVNEQDEAFTAEALIAGAGYAAETGNKKEAIDMYTKARDNFQTAPQVMNGEVDKRLAQLGILN